MKQPHKHAALIKAWADGAEIEVRSPYTTNGRWELHKNPAWVEDHEYRIKPEPKPDVVTYGFVEKNWGWGNCATSFGNLKLTFDGETGKLKSAEVL